MNMNNTQTFTVYVASHLIFALCGVAAGEYARVRPCTKPQVGDIVYRAFKPADSGRFYRVTGFNGAVVNLEGLDDDSGWGRALPHKCRLFGVVEGPAVFDQWEFEPTAMAA
jgi:hypothetical protein